MALSESVLSDLLDAFRAGEGVDLIRDAVQLVLQELIEVEATEHDRRRPLRTHRQPHHRTQRSPAAAVDDPGRRRRAAHPEAAQGQLLPVDPRAAPADRPGPLRGGDGGLRHTACRPARSMTSSPRWASTRGSRSPRCHGSVPGSTRSSGRSAPAASITSSSPTSTSTPPTSTSATRPSQVTSMAVVIATGITADG